MRDIIDLDQYPLDHPQGSSYAALVKQAKSDLAADGMFNLPGFLTDQARQTCVAHLLPRFASDAFRHARRHNVYFKKGHRRSAQRSPRVGGT